MTVTRSKRRNVPREERERRAKPMVVSRGGLSSKDKVSAIMMAMLILVFLVLIVMAECSSREVEASVAEPILKSHVVESDESEGSDQSLEDVIDEAFTELGSAVDEAFDELGRAVDEAFEELGRSLSGAVAEPGYETKLACYYCPVEENNNLSI